MHYTRLQWNSEQSIQFWEFYCMTKGFGDSVARLRQLFMTLSLCIMLTGCVVVRELTDTGYINPAGQFVLRYGNKYTTNRLTCLRPFSEGLAAVTLPNGWNYIDKSGKVVLKGKYTYCGEFKEGLAPVAVTSSNHSFDQAKNRFDCRYRFNGVYGYINKAGLVVIPPQFDNALEFSEGLAAVEVDGRLVMSGKVQKWMPGRCGYIDHSGKFVIQPQFSGNGGARKFSQGLAAVSVGGHFIAPAINVLPVDLGKWNLGKFGYIDKLGKVQVPYRFELAGDFSPEGLAPVGEYLLQSGGHRRLLFGFINREGEYVISPKYADARKFSEGLAAVRSSGLDYGYINTKGAFVIPPSFEMAGPFQEGLAVVGDDASPSVFGFINRSGELVIGKIFYGADGFSDGCAAVNAWDPNVDPDSSSTGIR